MINLKGLFIFGLGVAVGVIATSKFFEKKYSELSTIEIESVKKEFHQNRHSSVMEMLEDETLMGEIEKTDKPLMMNIYNNVLKKTGYKDYGEYSKKKDVSEKEDIKENEYEPVVVSPEEFGANGDYEIDTLTYYSDFILTDDNGNIIDDINGTIGEEALGSFGEYEEDCVYVRNDKKQKYYEILYDLDTYEKFIEENPHKV